MERLNNFNLRLNKEKCKIFVRKIKYLGHLISERGIEKDLKKVESIKSISRLKNADKVRSFVGMVLYYSYFISNASKMLFPFNQLLRKQVLFKWSTACEESYRQIQDELSSDRVLTLYDHLLRLVLETDASPYGIGVILSHKIGDSLKPISFIYRTLTVAEKYHSHIDREVTAIYWAITKCHQYLYERKFDLITDNKPLQAIFNPSKTLPSITALRLTRYVLFLRRYNYNIIHRPSKQHIHVDHFSRTPIDKPTSWNIYSIDKIHEYTINQITIRPSITSTTLKHETQQYPECSKLYNNLQTGKIENTAYSIYSGVILCGQ